MMSHTDWYNVGFYHPTEFYVYGNSLLQHLHMTYLTYILDEVLSRKTNAKLTLP